MEFKSSMLKQKFARKSSVVYLVKKQESLATVAVAAVTSPSKAKKLQQEKNGQPV